MIYIKNINPKYKCLLFQLFYICKKQCLGIWCCFNSCEIEY